MITANVEAQNKYMQQGPTFGYVAVSRMQTQKNHTLHITGSLDCVEEQNLQQHFGVFV